MHERRKSDGRVVPEKLPNKPGPPGAEVVEERRPAKGNAASETRPGPSAGLGVSSDLGRVRKVARKDKDVRFTALLHHVTVERLEEAYRAIRPGAAPGVDGVTWRDYGLDLEANLRDGSEPLPTFTAALPLLLSCLLTTCSQRSEQAVERLDEVTALVPGIDPRARERINAAKGNRRAARKSGQTVDKHLSGPRPDRAPSIEDEG